MDFYWLQKVKIHDEKKGMRKKNSWNEEQERAEKLCKEKRKARISKFNFLFVFAYRHDINYED